MDIRLICSCNSCILFPFILPIANFVKIIGLLFEGNNTEAQEFLSRGGQVIIRMRGLPYDCTAKQVVSQKYFTI